MISTKNELLEVIPQDKYSEFEGMSMSEDIMACVEMIDKFGYEALHMAVFYGMCNGISYLILHPEEWVREVKHFILIQDAYINAYA